MPLQNVRYTNTFYAQNDRKITRIIEINSFLSPASTESGSNVGHLFNYEYTLSRMQNKSYCLCITDLTYVHANHLLIDLRC